MQMRAAKLPIRGAVASRHETTAKTKAVNTANELDVARLI